MNPTLPPRVDQQGNIANTLCSWSDSQLKAFLEAHGVRIPQPREHEKLVSTAKDAYEKLAKRLGETVAYPGNWVYNQWSDSDLRAWLEERGWSVPEHTTRDQLIARVRRNSRLATLHAKWLSRSARSLGDSVGDTLFDAWSESQLKAFLDGYGVPVPQGSTRNKLIALARKHRATLLSSASSLSNAASSTISNTYETGTSKAADEYVRVTDDAKLAGQDAFDSAVSVWSGSRLKAFLDARDIPVHQPTRRDELLAKVRANKHKAAKDWSAWTFDTWDMDNLK